MLPGCSPGPDGCPPAQLQPPTAAFPACSSACTPLSVCAPAEVLCQDHLPWDGMSGQCLLPPTQPTEKERRTCKMHFVVLHCCPVKWNPLTCQKYLETTHPIQVVSASTKCFVNSFDDFLSFAPVPKLSQRQKKPLKQKVFPTTKSSMYHLFSSDSGDSPAMSLSITTCTNHSI